MAKYLISFEKTAAAGRCPQDVRTFVNGPEA
jgi:hypothetical protein